MVNFPNCPLCNGKIYCAGSNSEHGLAWVGLECSKCRLSYTHIEHVKRHIVDRDDCIGSGWSEAQGRMIGLGSWYADPDWDQVIQRAIEELKSLSSEELERLRVPKTHLSCRRKRRRRKEK